MVVDAVRTYLEAASGFTELTRKHAVAAAKTLLKESDERSGGAITRAADTAKSTVENVESSVRGTRVGHSIQALATDLIETSRANRAAIGTLVEGEVERLLDRLDLVRRDEHDRLLRRVAELERRLASTAAAQRRRAAAGEGARTPAAASAEPVRGAAAEAEQAPEPETAGSPVVEAEPAEAEQTPAAEPAPESAAEPAPVVEEPRGQEPGSAPAARPAARAGKAKANGARSRSTKGQPKRAATRKGSGPAKDGGK
ncbi:hypothetical protein [Actinorugispora endophytica]|uniref:Poly(Hydroxyalkanoate) granule associated protein phasin n=1 Tax=Actinorugispora endophytica TaxID=1605990 RepID=A0A4R6ULM0_9ACTN|nr:hypothetical protein [Actinorugispora endophytica]TDQ47542.1 hypothetical protein EV190_12110 [Actinorugispora endophytica]